MSRNRTVICVDDAGSHVVLAGDATDSLEQLHSLARFTAATSVALSTS
jgi:hypothetical protein